MTKHFAPFFLFTALCASPLDFKTAQAHFTQHVTNEHNKTITYSGNIYMKKPDLMLWEYQTPIQKSIYINRMTVTIYEPELYQATIFKNQEALNLVELFRKSTKVNNTTRKAFVDGNELTLKHNDEQFTKVFFRDKVENQVVINFTDYKKGIELENERFFFMPSSEIDVIRH